MTPSGQLKFTWPETWLESGTVKGDVLAQIREHTGVPGTMPFFAEIVDGPVMVNMMIDLDVSN